MSHVVVVGGSLGGLRATENLRLQGFDGAITVISQETHPPYTRPPLSKAALKGVPSLVDLEFRRRPEADDALWRRGVSAASCDLRARAIMLTDGEVLRFDGIVAATGVRSRRLPAHVCAQAHYIRTLDDAIALQPHLTPGARIAIIGAGFIGCEIAATAAQLGCSVDVVTQDPAPLYVPLGLEVGTAVRRRHERHGVRFHLASSITRVDAAPGGQRELLLADGTLIGCDVVVVAIGSALNVEWLQGNGLDLDDGVACDNWLRMGGVRAAVAVGDVARFPNPRFDEVARRVEHWQIPTDTARRAAATLIADLAGTPQDPQPFAPLPWFWSDQYDQKLQSFGSPGLGAETELLEGDLDTDAVVAYCRDGVLVGVVLLGMAAAAPRMRKLLLEQTSPA